MGNRDGSVTTSLYMKQDMVGRSLSLGNIGTDGTVQEPAAQLYTKPVSDTDSTLVGHLKLTGENRQEPDRSDTLLPIFSSGTSWGPTSPRKNGPLPVWYIGMKWISGTIMWPRWMTVSMSRGMPGRGMH